MIRITKSEDLKQLSDYPKIREYIADMLNRLIETYSEYCADGSISSIGAIVFLENLKDFDSYKAIGLYKELSADSFEWVISYEEYNIGCVVIDNDYALNLVCTNELYNQWLIQKG
ncbi:MAG: hypothetical protein NC452_20505 [Eubacterium sp.]|nr:hypothetical protein [Eubacterium sp.]